MHIGFDSVGHLVIDDQTDVLDIVTTSGKVGSNKEIRISSTKGLQSSLSLFLVLARVQRCCAPL